MLFVGSWKDRADGIKSKSRTSPSFNAIMPSPAEKQSALGHCERWGTPNEAPCCTAGHTREKPFPELRRKGHVVVQKVVVVIPVCADHFARVVSASGAFHYVVSAPGTPLAALAEGKRTEILSLVRNMTTLLCFQGNRGNSQGQ